MVAMANTVKVRRVRVDDFAAFDMTAPPVLKIRFFAQVLFAQSNSRKGVEILFMRQRCAGNAWWFCWQCVGGATAGWASCSGKNAHMHI
jgi:hypothetical protein